MSAQGPPAPSGGRLKLSADLSLPPEAITQTFGILAVRGAGKSNLAAVMAEEMYRARLPFVVVDPVGSWWGLRSSADGKEAGLEIPIFGGRRGDVPIERAGGQLLADLIVDDRLSCVLDISELSEGDKTKFLIDFAERLYARNTEPLHLFLEEADDYAPQRPFREQARLLRAWENLVRRGRSRGLGITLVTQRSAALNKNVLTQIETLFVLRTTSPQDRKAIEAWVEYHGQRRELLESLPQLAAGEAWVWSPQWLKLTKRVQIRRRSTFDSAATPKHVRGARPPATLADIDLGKMRERMAATIERAKQTDPRALRARISELERELAVARAATKIETVDRPILLEAELKRSEKLCSRAEALAEKLGVSAEALRSMGARLCEMLAAARRPVENAGPRPPRPAGTVLRPKVVYPSIRPAAGALNGLGGGERRVLRAVAQYDQGVSRVQLTILTGYKRSTRDTYLQRLRAQSLIDESDRSGLIHATPAGHAELGPGFEPLPTGRALLDHWLERLPEGERRILAILAEIHPKTLGRQEISEATGYKRSSRDTYLQRLGARRLIEMAGSAEIRASEQLF